jgi:hypothetical protein
MAGIEMNLRYSEEKFSTIHYFTNEETSLAFHNTYHPFSAPIKLDADSILTGIDMEGRLEVFHYKDFSHNAICDTTVKAVQVICARRSRLTG